MEKLGTDYFVLLFNITFWNFPLCANCMSMRCCKS